jgi:hypothetical protein
MTFIQTGRQTRRWPATTLRCPCTDHHLVSPPPCAALALTTTSCRLCTGHHLTSPLRKSLKKTIKEVIHIVPAGGEGEESSWYLEAGKGGECLWSLLTTWQIEVESKRRFCRCSKSKSNRCWPSTPPPQSYKKICLWEDEIQSSR